MNRPLSNLSCHCPGGKSHNSSLPLRKEPQDPCDTSHAVIPAALTPRQKDVFLRLLRGLTSKEIAAELGISHRTVEHHRLVLKRVLDALFPRPGLRAIAIAFGLIRDCPRGSGVICTVPATISCADARCERLFHGK